MSHDANLYFISKEPAGALNSREAEALGKHWVRRLEPFPLVRLALTT